MPGCAIPSARWHSWRICSGGACGCGRAAGAAGADRRVAGRDFVRGGAKGCACESGVEGAAGCCGRTGSGAGCSRVCLLVVLFDVWCVGTGLMRTRAERGEDWVADGDGASVAAGSAARGAPSGRLSAGWELGLTEVQPAVPSRTRSRRVSERRGTRPLCCTAALSGRSHAVMLSTRRFRTPPVRPAVVPALSGLGPGGGRTRGCRRTECGTFTAV